MYFHFDLIMLRTSDEEPYQYFGGAVLYNEGEGLMKLRSKARIDKPGRSKMHHVTSQTKVHFE